MKMLACLSFRAIVLTLFGVILSLCGLTALVHFHFHYNSLVILHSHMCSMGKKESHTGLDQNSCVCVSVMTYLKYWALLFL